VNRYVLFRNSDWTEHGMTSVEQFEQNDYMRVDGNGDPFAVVVRFEANDDAAAFDRFHARVTEKGPSDAEE